MWRGGGREGGRGVWRGRKGVGEREGGGSERRERGREKGRGFF